MSVKIIRPPLCADPANEVPKHLWPELVRERKRFCRERMPDDCRLLLFFIDDAAHSDWLGFKTRERYLKEGLQLNPEMVELALRGLKLTKPDSAVSFNEAIVLGKHGQHRDPSSRNTRPLGESQTAAYTLARLKRDHPELAYKVQLGQLSPNAAAIKAGFRQRTVQITPTVEGIVRTARRYLSVVEQHEVARHLSEAA